MACCFRKQTPYKAGKSLASATSLSESSLQSSSSSPSSVDNNSFHFDVGLFVPIYLSRPGKCAWNCGSKFPRELLLLFCRYPCIACRVRSVLAVTVSRGSSCVHIL
jgi:hypothetical protein